MDRAPADDARAPARAAQAVRALDWTAIAAALDAEGHAVTPPLLDAAACAALGDLIDDDPRFRASVDLARHGYGRGRYRYFAAPLPPLVAALREALYAPLADVANAWQARLGLAGRYPAALADLTARCRDAGQSRPTPLLLEYGPGGYNCLHQDRYGDVAFPLQAAVLLSTPGADFAGGEFLLVEQRPRMQSRGEAIVLERGACVLFPGGVRPVRGARGDHRVNVRHGVSRVRAGRRRTLGIIFHDAR